MKSPLPIWVTLVFSAGLTAAGCGGHPVERQLNGRWLGQAVENVDDASLAAATGWARGTSLEFGGRTVTVSIPAEEPKSAEYKVVSVHQRDVRLAVTRDDGKLDSLNLKLDDEHSMRWMVGDGRAVVLRREP